jgi:hypothetical protein
VFAALPGFGDIRFGLGVECSTNSDNASCAEEVDAGDTGRCGKDTEANTVILDPRNGCVVVELKVEAGKPPNGNERARAGAVRCSAC